MAVKAVVFNLLHLIFQDEPATVASEDVTETPQRTSRPKATPKKLMSTKPSGTQDKPDEVKNLYNTGEKKEDSGTVPEMPARPLWIFPTRHNIALANAALIIHDNQERRAELLEKAADAMGMALTKAAREMAAVIDILNEL